MTDDPKRSQDSQEEIKTVAPSSLTPGPLEYRVANLQGIGRREYQEDSFAFGNALDPEAIRRGGLLAVVADGMGGMKGGRQASETVISSLLKSFDSFDTKLDFAEQLNDAVYRAGESVYSMLKGAGGSTVVAGLIYDEKLYFTSVGDSYIFLLHDYTLVRLNHSHNVLNRDLLDEFLGGSLRTDTALRNPERDALTQFLGMPSLEETDFLRSPLPLSAGDVLLFCSDGVGGVLGRSFLEECLRHGQPEDMCAAIEAAIKKANRKSQDNYTALIVQCRN